MINYCNDCEIKVDEEEICDNCLGTNIIRLYDEMDVEEIKSNYMESLIKDWLKDDKLNIVNWHKEHSE